jgi:hypothetical protein
MMKVKRFRPVVAFFLCMSPAVLSAAPTSRPAAKAPAAPVVTVIGWVDAVKQGPGFVDVAGWAADSRSGAPVARIEILLNDKVVGTATTGVVRPDVAQAMKRNDYSKAGWKAHVDLKNVKPGSYRLTARGWNARGESVQLNSGPVNLRIP